MYALDFDSARWISRQSQMGRFPEAIDSVRVIVIGGLEAVPRGSGMPGLDREAMQAAVVRIQKLSDDHWWTLHPSCTLMDARAWVGPSGSRFQQALLSRQRELRAMLAQAVAAANDELASM
ncbi:hypothetical protein [Nonomuraea sp. NPDC049684]|uniref:hypothetical protein n=1 Tax=unclassified Nonomuraea TaxID=2593643 RepID=UPI0037B5EF54